MDASLMKNFEKSKHLSSLFKWIEAFSSMKQSLFFYSRSSSWYDLVIGESVLLDCLTYMIHSRNERCFYFNSPNLSLLSMIFIQVRIDSVTAEYLVPAVVLSFWAKLKQLFNSNRHVRIRYITMRLSKISKSDV